MVVTDRHDAAAALAWLVSVGADEAIADDPVDRFRVPPTAQLSPPPSLPPQGGGTRFDGGGGRIIAPATFPSPSPSKALPLEGGGWGGGGNAAETTIPLGTSEATATARELAAAA